MAKTNGRKATTAAAPKAPKAPKIEGEVITDLDSVLGTVDADTEAQRAAERKRIADLKATRAHHLAQVNRINKVLGVKTVRASSGGGGTRARSKMGAQGYCAKALVANGGDMRIGEIAVAAKKLGLETKAEDDVFATQIAQTMRKLAGEGVVANPTRGIYRQNKTTAKWVAAREAAIAAKAAA